MDIYERLAQDLREDRIRNQENMDKRMEKMEQAALELDKKSIQNYSAWRDYLHRYYTVVLAFIAGSGILSSLREISDYRLGYGILYALIGILIGFLGINIYFYIERKWIQAQHIMSGEGYYSFHTHSEVAEGNVLKSIMLNLRDSAQTVKAELYKAIEEKDSKKISWLRLRLRAIREERILIKFVGAQFGMMQKIWIGFVVGSLFLTFIGIFLVFRAVVPL